MTLEQYFRQLSEEQIELLLTLFGMNSFDELVQFYEVEGLEFDEVAKEAYDDMLAYPDLY